jgi:uncharacterized membrane protein
MILTPIVAVHMTAALLATALGPVALWARISTRQRPLLHRAFGYAWVTLMILTAVSAMFIRSTLSFSLAGFSPIHLLIPFTLINLFMAFRALSRGEIPRHRLHMQGVYFGACVVTGFFTLVPGRYLGDLIWHDWLRWI